MHSILINDGICLDGENILRKAGFTVYNQKISQDNLINEINDKQIQAIIVRSATVIHKDIIDSCPSLKIIGRAGLGMNNIDMEHARQNNIHVFNTPLASAPAVAEMVFAHIFSVSRNLYLGNRQLPSDRNLDYLKKYCAGGTEIRNKTLGIIGFGRAGQEVAKRALGLGMKVKAYDAYVQEANIKIDIHGANSVVVNIQTIKAEQVLRESDIITLHLPVLGDRKPFITRTEIEKMKDGAILINVSKSELIDEHELISALNSGKIRAAGLDVFNNENEPLKALINHPKISVSPHIAGETVEAQNQIGIEIANYLVQFFKK